MLDFDAVIFDMDGVIFDSERVIMECWIKLADKYGIPGIKEPYYACIGTTKAMTKEIMMNAYGADFPYDEYAAETSKMFHERYDGGRLPMKSGVKEILNYLKDSGKLVALASSTRKQSVVAELRDAGIIDYFDELITGDMVKRSKPDPDIFLLACKKLGLPPSRCYAIEDSYNGIRAAHAGGLRPIMVPDLLPADEEMRNLSVAVIDDLHGVIRYLEG